MSLIDHSLRNRWEDKAATDPGFAIALAIADLARAQYATSSNIHEASRALVALGTDVAAVASNIGDVSREMSERD